MVDYEGSMLNRRFLWRHIMYTLDFKNPCSVYFVGIGGVSMKFWPSQASVYPVPTGQRALSVNTWKMWGLLYFMDNGRKILPTALTVQF